MNGLFHRHRRRYPSQRSAALIFALAMIVLVAVAVLAFFSSATLNLHIESSRANRAKADLLAESGGDYAIAQVILQITDPSRSTITTVSGVNIYEPRFSTNSTIQRGTLALAAAKDPTLFNLVQTSIPTMDTNSSADSTTLPANNGRTLDLNRWNEPHLCTGSGFTTTAQLPNWIYMNRTNGPSSKATSETIGRFAYNIYNTGQLLNANVAGYPSGAASIASLMTYLKGGEMGADLTQLTNNNSIVLPQSSIDNLTAFRFPDSPSATNYVGRMLGAATNGYVAVENNDWFQGTAFTENMFDSRQDLIRYVTTQNPVLTNALPYLTHFSRSVEAPSYKAPSTSSNPDIPNIRAQAAGTITHYDDKGGTTTYTVSAGNSLVQRRFSLAKLAWLTYKGPSALLATSDPVYNPGGTAVNIQSCFGLSWNTTQERWDYVGPAGTTIQGSIETLAQIAAEGTPREPNFFETLKAGILSNTLGAAAADGCDDKSNLNSVSVCPIANNTLDANKDLHVLQIGANIIDGADADNYPTRLAMQFGPVAIEKAGVEDLPYFYSVDMPVFMSGTTFAPDATYNYWSWRFSPVEWVWIPELFEPHRPSTSTTSPSSIQINFEPKSMLIQAGFSVNTAFSTGESSAVLNHDLSALPAIQVPSSSFANFRNGPMPVVDHGAANRLGATIPSIITGANTNQDVVGFHLLSYSDPATYPQGLPLVVDADAIGGNDNTGHIAFLQAQNVIMRLQYQTPGGQWKTYSTLGGNEAFSSTDPSVSTGVWGAWRDDFGASPSPPGAWIPILKQLTSFSGLGYATLDKSGSPPAGTVKTYDYASSCFLVPFDPRGSRFGAANGHYLKTLAEVPRFLTNAPDVHFASATFYPSVYFNTTVNPAMGNLPQTVAFQDSDGVARMPDGGYGSFTSLGYGASSISTNAANPYSNVTNSTGYPARPVVLQRPYQSVAELGYVYRDVPWQTLDYFNGNGGDSALLDLFSVNDEPPITAGRVFMGTQQVPVMLALLSGAAQESDGTLPFPAATAQAIGSSYNKAIYANGRPVNPPSFFPTNVADVVTFMSTGTMVPPTPGINTIGVSLIKNRREAIVRALSSATQMRTWNILVDMVAQTGRFPAKSFTAGDFIVEGESHVWISVAIDRYTGKVVDEQIEKVNE